MDLGLEGKGGGRLIDADNSPAQRDPLLIA